MKAADVSTIVVVHNDAAMLDRCLTSLATAASQVHAHALVVDSASHDDPGATAARHGVASLRVPNRGLGAAFNCALEHEEVGRARYVLQLNPDVELPPGALDALVEHADLNQRCGILAPRQFDQHGRPILSIGVEPSTSNYWRAVNGPDAEWDRDPDRYRDEVEADWLMGACLLLRREMLDAIGGFDERFFLCSEEVDLCRRAREAGWTVVYWPGVSVVHGVADRRMDDHRMRLEEWSRILYIRKWHRPAARASMRLALVARLALKAARQIRSPEPTDVWRIRLSAALRFRAAEYGPARPLPTRTH